MHKHIKKVSIIFAMLICTFLAGCGAESKAESLAKYAEEQFMANDYDEYLQGLRDACGLQDLDIQLNVVYDYEYDYNKDSKELLAEGHLTFISDEIDNYYTTDNKEESSKQLAQVLNKLKNAYYQEPRYVYSNNKGKVILVITNGVSDEFHVKTSAGKDYEFSYYVNYDEIEIDGEIVYMEKARNEEYSSTPNSYTGSYDAKLSYGSGSVLMCSSEDAMDRYLTAVNNGNQGTIDEMTTNGEIAFTERNTKCNIVDKKITKAQVKLLDGSYAGNTVWVIIEALQEE